MTIEYIEHAAEAIANEVPFLSLSVRRRVAHALDNAGRLVTHEHDRQVAARAWNEGCAAGLHEANDKMRGVQNNPAINPYEREGETDADT